MAAYFNPKQVTFAPSAAVIENSGALGNAIYRAWRQNNQERQNDRLLQNKENDLAFNQQNEAIKNAHNERKFVFEQEEKQRKADIENKSNKLKGLAYIEQYPDLAQKLGINKDDDSSLVAAGGLYTPPVVDKKTNDMLNFEAGQNNPEFISYLNSKASQGNDASTTNLREYEAYAKSMRDNGLTPPPYHTWQAERDNYKTMGRGMNDLDQASLRTDVFSQSIGVPTYELTSVNKNKLTPEQQYEFYKVVAAREQAQRDRLPDNVKKDLADLSQVIFSADEISKLVNSNNSGILDRAMNNVNNYLGLGDDDKLVKRVLGDSSYALYRNYILKSLSGAAVTESEAKRFNEAFGTLWNNDRVVATKIMQNMNSLLSKLNTIKNSYDPVAYNYRFGDMNRTLSSAINNMQSVLSSGGVSPDGFLSKDDLANKAGQPNKTIIERRQTQDGRILVKYSDGTIGVQ